MTWTVFLTGLGLAALVAVAASRLSSLRAAVQSLESRAAQADRDLQAARRQTAQAEADHLFLARFVRELPHVAHELHAQAGGRQIPRLILGAAMRTLEPTKAVVAVRRRAAESDPARHTRLTVAAASPEGCVPLGTEIPIGHGEIGLAAESQRVMDRRDFDSQAPSVRKLLREETVPELKPDVVAPMIFGEQVVGVIAVEGLRRGVTEAKDALRLLAQVGAVSVHTQAKYIEMTATASVDGLTGIFNKRFLAQRLDQEIQRALDQTSCVSVFLFDLDHFKHYNDRNGHVAGDQLLQRLSKLVQENVRKSTVVGRYGGEEFLVILPGARRSQALAAAENVRQAIASHAFPYGSDQPLGFVSISGGVAEYPIDGTDAVSLVRAADEALYQAKRAGRNRVLAYEPVYLGGEEAQHPLPPEEGEGVRERAVLEKAPSIGAAGDAVALVAVEEGSPRSAPGATDFTPVPGTLFSLAMVTPAAGIPKLTLQPSAAVLNDARAEPAGASPEPASPEPGLDGKER
jgi:diguanylate cyclase (GGDEF)-like protein